MPRERPLVLIVDDEPDMCWALENILGPEGYRVRAAMTGREALALLAEEHYAAAFVDAKLPDLDGLELAVIIHHRSPHTAIVLISGYFYQEDGAVTEGMERNLFIGFLAKPFDLQEVRALARLAVGQARKEAQADGLCSCGG